MSNRSSPAEDLKPNPSIRKGTKPRDSQRVSKRSNKLVTPPVAAVKHKRTWKACERCRMKKTKCNGGSPCERCRDDNLICIMGNRKKTECRQMPRGYAEVLENTTVSLSAAVQKLYRMVLNKETWNLAEPSCNDKGEATVHEIAKMLGCIRVNGEDTADVFPASAEDLAALRNGLQEVQDANENASPPESSESISTPSPLRTDRASSTASSVANTPPPDSQMSYFTQQPLQGTPSSVKCEPCMQDDYSTSIAQAQAQPQTHLPSASITNGFTSSPTTMYPADTASFRSLSSNDDAAAFLSQTQVLGIAPDYMSSRQPYQNIMTNMYMDLGEGYGDGTIRPDMLEGGIIPMYDEYSYFDQMARS